MENKSYEKNNLSNNNVIRIITTSSLIIFICMCLFYYNESSLMLAITYTFYALMMFLNIKFLKIHFNPTHVLSLAVFFDIIFIGFKFNENFNFLWLIVIIPLPFAIYIFLKYPKIYLNLIKNLWPILLFLLYSTISLLWSKNSIYGFRKLLILAVRGFIPGLYIFILYKYYKPRIWKWNTFLLITFIYGLIMVYFSTGNLRRVVFTFNPIPISRALLR